MGRMIVSCFVLLFAVLIQAKRDVYLEILTKNYVSSKIQQKSDFKNAGEPLFLTPLIEKGLFDEARNAARVDPKAMLNKESYSGFLTVDKQYNSNLYFWYFPVDGEQNDKTPTLIWLQGGPGASSLFGLFTETGPFSLARNTFDKISLKDMENSWGNHFSLLFIDNPVGTGFSFTENVKGYATNQTTIGEQLYIALQQFMDVFPELRSAPLFIGGESYAGKHIPSLAIQIHKRPKSDKPINLQGLAIGDGYVDPLTQIQYSYFAREVGLVDDHIANGMKQAEEEAVAALEKGDIKSAYEKSEFALNRLMETSNTSIYNYLQEWSDDFDKITEDYLADDNVRRALHVGSKAFDMMNRTVHKYLKSDHMNSVKQWLEELLEHYRVMSYSGQLDVIVAYRLSVNMHKSLKFSGSNEYNKAKRYIWRHENRVAGYYKVGGLLTEVMVRNAGHMVPTDASKHAFAMIKAFAMNKSLNDTTNYV